MKAAFFGLGAMGKGMALNLAKSDLDLYTVTGKAATAQEARAKGYTVKQNRPECADCELIFLCLPDTPVVEEVLFGEDQLARALRPGTVIVDCSTINYLSAVEIGKKCAELGLKYLDCPISGQKARADAGTLTIMCGGEEETFNAVKPYLDLMGTTVLYMGPGGSGQLTKMINNCAFDICIASFCELMPVGVMLGLDVEKLAQVFTTATGSSYASQNLLPKVLEGNFNSDFSMARAYKDLTSMFQVTGKYALPLPTLYGTMQTYQMALQNGDGDYYKGAMIKVFEKMLGVECRKPGFTTEELNKQEGSEQV